MILYLDTIEIATTRRIERVSQKRNFSEYKELIGAINLDLEPTVESKSNANI